MMLGVPDPAAAQTPTPLILLGGASGSGKSYLARRYGRPRLRLDDFYREIAEDVTDSFPRTPYGEIDWDHPGTWNADAALAATRELLATGETSTPKYDSSISSYVGRRRVRRPEGGVIVAETIFASTALPLFRAAGLPVTAYYVDSPRWLTTIQRFARDVREHRKPVPFLLKRGLALYRADPALRRSHLEAGFVPVSKRRIKTILAAASA